jgi:hypothetical protein
VIARHKHLNVSLAADEVTPLAVIGGLVLWLLRLSLAPTSTLTGFRAWVLDECPIAPGRRANCPAQAAAAAAVPRAIGQPRRGRGRRGDTKSARFLALVTEHHGPLPAIPLRNVATISAALAPQVDLNTGAARTVLRRAVLAARAHCRSTDARTRRRRSGAPTRLPSLSPTRVSRTVRSGPPRPATTCAATSTLPR